MEYDGLITKPTLEELYHHGIKGQKWGVQNGPPYPLSSKISTGRKLKKGNSVTKKKLTKSEINTKKRLDDWEKFEKELRKSEEYMSFDKKASELESRIEKLDVGAKSERQRARNRKQIDELSKELKATLYDRNQLYDFVKSTYQNIQEYKKKVPKNVQEYIDNHEGYDLESKAYEYKRYLNNPDKWISSPDRYKSNLTPFQYLDDSDRIKELGRVEKVSNSGDPRKFKNFISTDKGYKKYWELQGQSITDTGDDELNELMFMEYEEWLKNH